MGRGIVVSAVVLLIAGCGGGQGANGWMPNEDPAWVDVEVNESGGNCALSNRGRIRCWGGLGEFGPGEFPLPEGVRLAKMSYVGPYLCGLTFEGSIWCSDDRTVVPEGADFVEIGLGLSSGCALRQNGEIACFQFWPTNYSYPESAQYRDMDVGMHEGAAIRASDSGLEVWGMNPDKYVIPVAGRFDKVVQAKEMVCATREDTKLVECFAPNGIPVRGAMAEGPVSWFFDSLSYGVCAELRDTGLVRCWSLFSDDENTRDWPPEIGRDVPAVRFRAGSVCRTHACGVVDDGSMLCWGAASSDELVPPLIEDGEW